MTKKHKHNMSTGLNGVTEKCPKCKDGRMTIEVHMEGKVDRVEIGCAYCDGAGRLTPARLRAIWAEARSWCRCGNPSGAVTYHDDGEHPSCAKHCWTCDDCGKITQIG